MLQALKVEFREHFKNITRVMDCVTCDKCKLWGKLQVLSINIAVLSTMFSCIADRARGDNELFITLVLKVL